MVSSVSAEPASPASVCPNPDISSICEMTAPGARGCLSPGTNRKVGCACCHPGGSGPAGDSLWMFSRGSVPGIPEGCKMPRPTGFCGPPKKRAPLRKPRAGLLGPVPLTSQGKRGQDGADGYIMPMPSMPPGGIGIGSSFLGASATDASVVIIRPAMEAAFCRAIRTTLVGSRIPMATMSP